MRLNKFRRIAFALAASSIMSIGASCDLAAKPLDPLANGLLMTRMATFSIELVIEESCNITIPAHDHGGSEARIKDLSKDIEAYISESIKISCAIEKTAGLIKMEKNPGGSKPYGASREEQSREDGEIVGGNESRGGGDIEPAPEFFSIIYF